MVLRLAVLLLCVGAVPRSSQAARPAPLNILAVRMTNGSAVITWEGGKGPFQLLYRTNSTEPWTRVAPATSENAAVHNEPGRLGFYQVTTDLQPPPAPWGLQVSADPDPTRLNLSWAAVTDDTAGAGLFGYRVYRNGLLLRQVQAPLAATVDSGLQPDTLYTYTVSALDKAGNESARTPPVSARTSRPPDVEPPTVALTAPAPDSTLSGTVTLTAEASDNVGVSRVEFWDDTAGLLGVSTSPPYRMNLETTSLTEGSHVFQARARDHAGLVSLSSPVMVTVSQDAPAPEASLWAQSFGGTGFDYGQAVAVDAQGNIVLTGSFDYQVDFGGGMLPVYTTRNILLAKYSPTGEHLWSRAYGGSGSGRGMALATDASGHLFVGGYFAGSLDFGGGALSGWDAPFIAKMRPDGTHAWSTTPGGFGSVQGMAVTQNGDLLCTGHLVGASSFGSGIYVAQYDGTDGRVLWSRSFGGDSSDIGYDVAVDSQGNVLVAGSFIGTVDFGNGAVASEGIDAFVLKLSQDGATLWSRTYGGALADRAKAICIDPADHVLVAGNYMGTTSFGGATFEANDIYDDAFLLKLDPSGQHVWSKAIGGSKHDWGNALACDEAGDVVVAGNFMATVDFGGGSLSSAGNYDAYVAKYEARNGTHVWSRAMGGTGTDQALAVAVAPTGHVVLTGRYFSVLESGATTLPSNGESDIFLMQLAP